MKKLLFIFLVSCSTIGTGMAMDLQFPGYTPIGGRPNYYKGADGKEYLRETTFAHEGHYIDKDNKQYLFGKRIDKFIPVPAANITPNRSIFATQTPSTATRVRTMENLQQSKAKTGKSRIISLKCNGCKQTYGSAEEMAKRHAICSANPQPIKAPINSKTMRAARAAIQAMRLV